MSEISSYIRDLKLEIKALKRINIGLMKGHPADTPEVKNLDSVVITTEDLIFSLETYVNLLIESERAPDHPLYEISN